MVRPALQNLPLPFRRTSSRDGLDRSSSHRRRQAKDLLSSTGHTASSVKSFASSSTVGSSTKADGGRRSRPIVFVGRTKYIERLVSELKLDETRLVVIQGSEGCGKTWLLEEFRRVHDTQQGEDENASLVLFSSFAKVCAYDDPLAPIWQALLPALEERDDILEEFSPLLGSVLPHLYPDAGNNDAPDGSARPSHRVKYWDRERLVAFLLRLLRRLSVRGPTECGEKARGLVWCLDDLNDASPEVLQLLQTVLLNVPGVRFLASCRPVTDNNTPLARWLVYLKRHKLKSTAMVMRPLSNLSLKNIIQLLELQYLVPLSRKDDKAVPNREKYVRALAKKTEEFTGGHALSVSQFLRLVNDLGCFKEDEFQELPHTTLEKISKLPIDPATCLHQVVRLRLRALPKQVQRGLCIASAYSSQMFRAETLYCLCRSSRSKQSQDKYPHAPLIESPEDLRQMLDYASSAGFLTLLGEDGVYAFAHPLVRDIVLRTLSNNDPLRLHYQLGRVFRYALLGSTSFELDEVLLSPDRNSLSHSLESRGVSHWNRVLDDSGSADKCEIPELTTRDLSDLAAWNCRVAMQAQRTRRWLVSSKHFEKAVSLLERMREPDQPENDSKRQNLWLEWTCQRIPVELACGHYEVSKNLATQVRRTLTTSPLYVSTARSAIVAINHRQFMQGAPGDPSNEKSIEGCLKWLKELGDGLPDLLNACSDSPSKCIERLLTGTKAHIAKFDFATWYRPALSMNQDIEHRMKALECLANVSAVASPSHYTMAMLRGLQLSIQYGRFAMTPLCFLVLSDILVRQDKWGSAMHYAEMGLKMAEEKLDVEMDTRALVLHAQLAALWGERSDSDAAHHFAGLNRHTETLLWTSTWTYATFSRIAWFWFHFSTCALSWLSQETRAFAQTLADARQEKLCALLSPYLELLDALQYDARPGEQAPTPEGSSSGKDAQQFHPQFKRYAYSCRMVASFWKNDTAQAGAWLSLLTSDGGDTASAQGCSEMRSATDHPSLTFLHGMVAWSLVAEHGPRRARREGGTADQEASDMKRLMDLSKLGESYSNQLETWTSVQEKHAGENGSGGTKALLHLLRCQDEASRPEFVNVFTVLKQYDVALADMERSGAGNGLLALSYEQAGLYAIRQRIPTATRYLAKALGCYRAWGATSKARQVEVRLREAEELTVSRAGVGAK